MDQLTTHQPDDGTQSEAPAFRIGLRLLENYLFEIDFGEFGDLITDEPEPLGNGEGPNPVRLLGAAVGNCLAASLLFALRKFKDDPGTVSATVDGWTERRDGRWRVASIAVTLQLQHEAAALAHLDRVLAQFEEFCVVTQSVREGIPIAVTVADGSGRVVKAAP